MIRRRRRCLPIESDNSEDDTPQKRKLRSSSTTCTHSRVLSKSNNGNKRRNLPIVTSEESSNSDTEEIVHLARRASMRALSDYDTGNSSDNEEESLAPRRLPQSANADFVKGVNKFEASDSSSEDDVIQPRAGKRHRRLYSSSSTESSDSGVQRKKKKMKLCTSSSESNSEDLSSDEPIRRLRERRNRPNTSSDSGPSRIQPRRSQNHSEQNSRIVSNGVNWRRVSEIGSESESTSDNDIRPRVLRQRSQTAIQSNSSSSSDTEDEVPIRRPMKRGAVKSIVESDEDNGSRNKNSSGSLSDTDNESEVCPICLNRFNLQEIGKPSTCDHCFCLSCIKEWSKNNNTCPVDRQSFSSITVLSSIGGAFVEKMPVFNIQRMMENWEVVDLLEADDNEFINISNYSSDEDDLSEVCCGCHMMSTFHSMIYCDVCFDVYHLQCVNPPLETFPAGPWICTDCEAGSE